MAKKATRSTRPPMASQRMRYEFEKMESTSLGLHLRDIAPKVFNDGLYVVFRN